MDIGPGITAQFPVLTGVQMASVARRGTRHHTTAGEVLLAGLIRALVTAPDS